jgi:hypothetical protein
LDFGFQVHYANEGSACPFWAVLEGRELAALRNNFSLTLMNEGCWGPANGCSELSIIGGVIVKKTFQDYDVLRNLVK